MVPTFFQVWKSDYCLCIWNTTCLAICKVLLNLILSLIALRTLSPFFSDTENYHEWLKSDWVKWSVSGVYLSLLPIHYIAQAGLELAILLRLTWNSVSLFQFTKY